MTSARRSASDLIEGTARATMAAIDHGDLPVLTFPIRALRNVHYDSEGGVFTLGGARKIRTLGAGTARSFAQVLHMMALARQVLATGDFATKREAYYVSKNWGECRFHGQPESDAILDDIEALAALEGLSREDLGFVPEEHAGSVVGRLVVIDEDPAGERLEVDCAALGRGAYAIPHAVDTLRFRTDARFVLAIETGGMFQRLVSHRFWRDHHCILVEMGGVPTRATRRFVRRLADEHALPVYCFTDCDPYGFANIYRTFKVGSGNAAHVSERFSVPSARFLGVTPDDIDEFDLHDATHPLLDVDVKRARDALDHDPFFAAHAPWRAAIDRLLAMGVRAEQQALAKWGLNFVIHEYLPRKLAAPETFLP
jgi:DNA topoisomerase-6 subunit A